MSPFSNLSRFKTMIGSQGVSSKGNENRKAHLTDRDRPGHLIVDIVVDRSPDPLLLKKESETEPDLNHLSYLSPKPERRPRFRSFDCPRSPRITSSARHSKAGHRSIGRSLTDTVNPNSRSAKNHQRRRGRLFVQQSREYTPGIELNEETIESHHVEEPESVDPSLIGSRQILRPARYNLQALRALEGRGTSYLGPEESDDDSVVAEEPNNRYAQGQPSASADQSSHFEDRDVTSLIRSLVGYADLISQGVDLENQLREIRHHKVRSKPSLLPHLEARRPTSEENLWINHPPVSSGSYHSPAADILATYCNEADGEQEYRPVPDEHLEVPDASTFQAHLVALDSRQNPNAEYIVDSGPLEEDLIREHAANGYSAETSPIAQSFSPTTTQEIEDCLRHLKLRLLTDSGHARQSSTLDRSPVDLAQDLSIEEFQNSPRPSTHAGSDRDLEQHILYPIATLGLARDSKSNRNKSRKMNAARGSRFLDLPKGAEDKMLKQKIAVAQEAQKQQTFIAEKLRRNGHEMPPFTFLELIGKGSYGRVFKCRDDLNGGRLVALKVIDVDAADYKGNPRDKDEAIDSTTHEIKILKQLTENKTKNVNVIFDAFQIHSQLWLVNEYCPGGSVHTLMRATGGRLDERYIVPIARELAAGLKAIHDAGIIHRDVKSANVMIHENGSLQMIDFGVSGVLQTNFDKRSTVVGTAYWMAPELHKNAPPSGLNYGTEVDIWAFGCTLVEIATGTPPRAGAAPGRKLGADLSRNPPRLDDKRFSKGLCALVASVLHPVPLERPSMATILAQPYISETEATHPTTSLADLVKIFYRWTNSGGQRHSLFIQGGAAAPELDPLQATEGWNYSTTLGFEQQVAIEDNTSLIASEFDTDGYDDYSLEPSITPKLPSGSKAKMADQMTPELQAENEERIRRGGQNLGAIFNEQKPAYKYEVKDGSVEQAAARDKHPALARSQSDLPLRSANDPYPANPKEVEVSGFHMSADPGDVPNIDLANVGTIKANRMNRINKDSEDEGSASASDAIKKAGIENKNRATREWKMPVFESHVKDVDAGASAGPIAKRATMDWKFPSYSDTSPQAQPPEAPAMPSLPVPSRPTLMHSVTAPVGEVRQSLAVLDLDELYESDNYRSAPVSDDESIAYDSDAFATGPPSDNEVTIHPRATRPSGTQPGGLFDLGIESNASISTIPGDRNINEIAIGEDGETNDYDQFWFQNTDVPNYHESIEAYLDEKGVHDPLERSALRREYRDTHSSMKLELRKEILDAGYAEFKKRKQAAGMYDLPHNDPNSSWWEDYNPATNPSEDYGSYSLDQTSQIGDSILSAPVGRRPSSASVDPTLGAHFATRHAPPLSETHGTYDEVANATIAPATPGGLASAEAYTPAYATSVSSTTGRVVADNSNIQHERSTHSATSSINHVRQFPNLVPPSAEALTEGASEEVLTSELTRLFSELVDGFGILHDHLENEEEFQNGGFDSPSASPPDFSSIGSGSINGLIGLDQEGEDGDEEGSINGGPTSHPSIIGNGGTAGGGGGAGEAE